MEQFEEFNATSLYCPKCSAAVRVRARLLLVLPDGELIEYVCAVCGESLAKKKSQAGRFGSAPERRPPGRPGYL